MAAFLWWTTKSGQDKTLYFDVVSDVTIEMTSSATEHPVEDSANVADHVKRELDRVSLEVFVSNEPIYDSNDRGGKVSKIPIHVEHYKAPLAFTPGAAFSAIGGAIHGTVDALLGKKEEYAIQVLQWDTSFDAVSDTFEALEKVRDDIQLVNVVTRERVFENMLLTHVSSKADAGTGTGRTFQLDFTELRKVKVRITNAPKPTETRAELHVSKGSQGQTTFADDSPKMSYAKAGAEALLPHLPPWVRDVFTKSAVGQ